jgi:hypothetical protein
MNTPRTLARSIRIFLLLALRLVYLCGHTLAPSGSLNQGPQLPIVEQLERGYMETPEF